MSRLALAALVGVAVGSSGCAESLVRTKLTISSLALSSIQATINRDGIGVGAQLLGFVEFQQGRAPSIEVRWKEIDIAAARATNAREGEEPTKQLSGRVPLVPVPSVFLAIDNRSSSPVEFKGAKIWLENTKGKKFPAVLDVVDVAARADVYLREKYPNAAQSEDVIEGLRERVTRLPLFHDKLVIQPGSRYDGILVIDLPAFSIKEADVALGSDEKFALKLTALGGASEPLEISIPFERTSASIQVDCPQNKPPTTDICKLPKL